MYIIDYLKAVVAEKLDGDRSRFDELWELVPGFSEKLRSYNSNDSWLHWTPKTFDGWYCIQVSNEFKVYYQERGCQIEATSFSDERQAIKFAIDSSTFSLG